MQFTVFIFFRVRAVPIITEVRHAFDAYQLLMRFGSGLFSPELSFNNNSSKSGTLLLKSFKLPKSKVL